MFENSEEWKKNNYRRLRNLGWEPEHPMRIEAWLMHELERVTAEGMDLREKLSTLKLLLQLHENKLEPFAGELKGGDKMPKPLAMVCQVLAQTIDENPEADNYIGWGWKDEKNGKEYHVLVQYADGESPEAKAARYKEELDALKDYMAGDGPDPYGRE